MKNKIINNNYINSSTNIIIILLGILLCTNMTINLGYQIGLVISLIPILFLIVTLAVTRLSISLTFLFALNYLIMGIIRYYSIPIPVTNMFDMIFSTIIAFIIIKQIYQNDDFNNVINVYTLISFIWLLYCIINLGNNITGSIHFESWLRTVRPIAIYPFVTCIVLSISCKNYTFINYFLIILAIFTILGASKGIWQKHYGFDSTEYAWLMSAGGKTHLINTGIRYFSFFTDAANFGCSMGYSFIILIISAFYTKKHIIKILFIFAAILAIIGMFLSGTRAALAVPFTGMALYTCLAKNFKIILISGTCFIISLYILMFTTLGNSNQYIRRMRTAFNVEDASFQVRLDNQKALKAYMREAPFGIGLGVTGSDVSVQNKFHFVSTCAPDSDLVNIWMRLGEVGLTVYLILQFFLYAIGSFIVLFKIKNAEIRGPLTAMLCGCAGLLVASYANMINFQFPNGLLVYSCITFIYLGPFLDKQYTKEHESK